MAKNKQSNSANTKYNFANEPRTSRDDRKNATPCREQSREGASGRRRGRANDCVARAQTRQPRPVHRYARGPDRARRRTLSPPAHGPEQADPHQVRAAMHASHSAHATLHAIVLAAALLTSSVAAAGAVTVRDASGQDVTVTDPSRIV